MFIVEADNNARIWQIVFIFDISASGKSFIKKTYISNMLLIHIQNSTSVYNFLQFVPCIRYTTIITKSITNQYIICI